MEATLSKNIRKKEALCLSLANENVGNFQNEQGWHSGSHAIAWAAITTSAH